jgi:hypothetical protein
MEIIAKTSSFELSHDTMTAMMLSELKREVEAVSERLTKVREYL